MINNYLRIAINFLYRNKVYTFINVTGLAVGMAVCMLIGLYIADELSFDRFHEKSDRLFVVPGRTLATPYSLATALESLPEVDNTSRLWKGRMVSITRARDELKVDLRILLAEPSFFELFSFSEVAGTPSAALTDPGTAIITASLAGRIFGSEDPVGQLIEYQRSGPGVTTHSAVIGAVVRDPPPNSTIQFDVIAPLSSLGPAALRENQWGYDLVETYVQTVLPVQADQLSSRIVEMTEPYLGTSPDFEFSALPLPALHLSGFAEEGLAGQSQLLYVFATIAIFVLFIGAANYINLVTTLATKRMKEIGVRKAVGAGRLQLVLQFVMESALFIMGALAASLVLVDLALPVFSRIFAKELGTPLGTPGYTVLLPAGIALLTILACVYPAFVISRFKPTETLRGKSTRSTLFRALGVRQALIVLQFTISVALLVGTVVIYRQLDYIQNKDLGFDDGQVLVVSLGAGMPVSVRESFKQRILSHPGILSASIPNAVPSRFIMGYTRSVDDAAPQSLVSLENVTFRPAVVDFDFIDVLRLRVLAGRNFSRDIPSDMTRAYILNRTAVELLGWSAEEAIGQSFKLGTEETPVGEIVGVVDDFHLGSLHQNIEPVVLQLHTLSPVGSMPFLLLARLEQQQIQSAMNDVRQEFNQIAPPGATFEFFFLDERFKAMYRSEEQMKEIIASFATLAIFIACLGLYGQAVYTTEHRTREIGIRKVMGGSVSSIVLLLTNDFSKLVLVSNVVAWPVAYVAMNQWLASFAYRIDLTPVIFVGSGVIALCIAWVTVGSTAARAASARPVLALRYEG